MTTPPRRVWVTGAGRNLGRHLAVSFGRLGWSVAVNARSADAVAEVAAEVEDAGGVAVPAVGDVADRDAMEGCWSTISDELGGVDVLVNCAAVRVHRDFLELSPQEWRLPLQVGLDGAFHCTQLALPGMVEAGFGRIVSLAGVTGQTGAPRRAGVVATKAGLIGLTKALALEFADTGVTVNAISPGLIDTERGPWTSVGDDAATAAHYEERKRKVPVQRMGRPSEVVAACHYLVSDDAGFVTGQTLSVNGGMYLGS